MKKNLCFLCLLFVTLFARGQQVGNPGFETGSFSPPTIWNAATNVWGNARPGTRAVQQSGVETVLTGLTPNTTHTFGAWIKLAIGGQRVRIGTKNLAAGTGSFTNLPPGKYTFFVLGADYNGMGRQPFTLEIEILGPFWRSWWAYCLFALLAAGIILLIARFVFLRQMIKKEVVLLQTKLTFFTNVSHEIRTHLTLITAPIEKLIHTKKPEDFERQKNNLALVKSNADRLLRLVTELMDFRKAESENLKLQIAEHRLIPFLQEVFHAFQELTMSKSIKATFTYSNENITLLFDRQQLEKVFFNLMDNAIKFTPAGGNIAMLVEEKADKVCITITDNGIGIAPEYLDKLFNNFFQVADYGLQNTGYGIGLALTKTIVGLHKGEITVASQQAIDGKNGGTSFTVALPCGRQHLHTEEIKPTTVVIAQAPTLPEALFPHVNVAEGSPAAPDKKPTILISEDNPDLQQLIRDCLQENYELITTENGLQGWQHAIEEIPDLVISDVMMPEMDGFAFCAKLKTDECTSHIPVILLTARNSQTDHVSGLETGADVYLTKPFSPRILELHIRNLLACRQRMRTRYSQQIAALPQPEAVPAQPGILPVAEEKAYMNPLDKAFLDKLAAITDEYMDDTEFGVPMICKKMAMSRTVLYKKLQAVAGLSVNDFIKSIKLKKAADMLLEKRHTVYEISYAVGFNDSKYFSREFKKLYGKSPRDFSGLENTEGEE